MADARRSPSQIAAELERLKQTNLSDRDRMSLIHEISVYQEELIVQNEALMRAQSALEETRDRFIELYDFAPNAYVVLDEGGIISQCNLTAAALLNRNPHALEGLPFIGFVVLDSRRQYANFLRRCRAGVESEVAIEAALYNGERRFEVQLVCRPRRDSGAHHPFLTSIVDITERKELEREKTRTASEQAALAVHLLAAIDEERRRIARDLHDDLGQQLTAIRLKLESALQTEATLPSAMASVERMIDALDKRLHFVATDLHPASLDLGLVSAVRQYVRDWMAAYEIRAVFHVDGVGDGDVSADTETHLFRIIQEALNNVAKHAAARGVSVWLTRRHREITLVVEDDGQGFDLHAAHTHGSPLGLVGMRERAQMCGGRLRIETARGQGTSVFVHLPASDAPPAR